MTAIDLFYVQRFWRTVTRRRYQLTRARVRLQNQLEALLEEAHIKLSSLVSALLGVSARRMLKALADGETNPAALAALADKRLRATQAQLCDALGACTELSPLCSERLDPVAEFSELPDHSRSSCADSTLFCSPGGTGTLRVYLPLPLAGLRRW